MAATQRFFWKNSYGGTTISEIKRVKKLEAENSRLKPIYANLSLEHDAVKDVLVKKFYRLRVGSKASITW